MNPEVRPLQLLQLAPNTAPHLTRLVPPLFAVSTKAEVLELTRGMRVFAIQGVLARGFLDLNEIRNATDYKKEYDRSNGRPAFLVCCLDKPGTEAGGLATSPRGAADAQLPQVNYGLDRTVNLALGITQSGKPNSSKTEIDLGVCSSVDTEQLNTAVDEALHSLGLERPTAKSKIPLTLTGYQTKITLKYINYLIKVAKIQN